MNFRIEMILFFLLRFVMLVNVLHVRRQVWKYVNVEKRKQHAIAMNRYFNVIKYDNDFRILIFLFLDFSHAIDCWVVKFINVNKYVTEANVVLVLEKAHERVRVARLVRWHDYISLISRYVFIEYENLSCSEEVLTCGDTCDRKLDCGLHRCVRRCHLGDCESVRICRWFFNYINFFIL